MLKKYFVISLILFFVLDANAQFVSNFLPNKQGKIVEMITPPSHLAKYDNVISVENGNTDTYIPVSALNSFYSKYVNASSMTVVPGSSNFVFDDYLHLRVINGNVHVPESAKKLAKFNVKQDDLSNVYVDLANFKIQVLNHRDKPCDMSVFDMSVDNEAFSIDENFYLKANKSPIDFALNPDLRDLNITIRHIESGLQYVLQCSVYFINEIKINTDSQRNSEDLAYALVPLNEADEIYFLVNLETNAVKIVQLPIAIFANGVNGQNGKNCTNGANGTNAYSYTDSNGAVHRVAGTVGKPGTDATNGENGGRGGNVMMCVPTSMENINLYRYVRLSVRAGVGGVGGRAGRGGAHGTGSGKTGRAPDGRAGTDGTDGETGSFVYVVADTKHFIDSFNLLDLCK